jgi:hypothetical protein
LGLRFQTLNQRRRFCFVENIHVRSREVLAVKKGTFASLPPNSLFSKMAELVQMLWGQIYCQPTILTIEP